MQDPRMIEVMGVLMGIDLQAFSRPEGSGDDESAVPPRGPATPPPEPTPSSSRPSEPPVREDIPMAEPEEEDEDAIEEKRAKASAEAQKKIGSDAYRKRDFATAAEAFQKAWDLWPKDITFLTNLSGKSSLLFFSRLDS